MIKFILTGNGRKKNPTSIWQIILLELCYSNIQSYKACGEFELTPYIPFISSLTDHVLQVDEGVIDSDNLHLLGVETSTGHQTTDAAKSEKWTRGVSHSGQ